MRLFESKWSIVTVWVLDDLSLGIIQHTATFEFLLMLMVKSAHLFENEYKAKLVLIGHDELGLILLRTILTAFRDQTHTFFKVAYRLKKLSNLGGN